MVSLVDAAQEHLPDGMYDAMLPLLDAIEGPGKTMRRGRITKRGNRQARWGLTMAANSLLLYKKSTPLVEWGKSLHKRVGRKKAIVAIARKLASVLWAIWLREQEYDPKLAT